MDERLIQKWVDERLISPEQAERMRADLHKELGERRSGRFIVAVSTVGAVLLGASAILFIASNWQRLDVVAKLSIMVGSTLAALFGGYFLKYERGQLERVGGAILLLSALMFGATIMLTAQMYHVQANQHWLLLLWLAGVMPLVYGIRSTPITVLGSGLVFLWLGQYVFSDPNFFAETHIAVLFVVAGLALFGIGGLHYQLPDMGRVARVIRIISLKVTLFALFVLTFRYVSLQRFATPDVWHAAIPAFLFGVTAMALAALVLDGWVRRSDPWARIESFLGLSITALLVLFLLLPSSGQVYLLVFNLLFAALTLLLVYYGSHRADIRIVNMGIFWLALFLLAKYFDWFWSLLDRAVFFFVGGLILVAGGIALEKQRRRIKSRMQS